MTTLAQLEPDGAEAFDFLFTLRKSEFDMPEKRLMSAVLEDAITSFRHGASITGSPSLAETSRRKDLQAMEAREWLESEERDYPFAFVPICEALAIEPGWLRGRVLMLGPLESKWRRDRKSG